MRCILTILVILASVSASGKISTVPCGSEWINFHTKNPDLVGVYVQQYPDNMDDSHAYEGKHPVMVIFVFKGNRAHQVSYTPIGQVQDGFWWDIPAEHWIFERMSNDLKPDTHCGYWVVDEDSGIE